MAEQIPYGVATSFINKLAALAFHEFGRINGVKDELERLKNKAESIKAVLLDADRKQEHDNAVRLWITRLKDVLLEADDLFDDIATEDLRRKVDGRNKVVKEVSRFFSSSNPVVCRRQLAQNIEKILKNFTDVVKDINELNLIPRHEVGNQTEKAGRETSSFVWESDIIGREDSKREILNLLSQPHENINVCVIAIVGIGGLGKTTIAQLAYNDLEVQRLFEKKMWVCVSDNFDVKTIMKNILNSLLPGGIIDDKQTLDSLQHKLRENLSGKRYLLVMDDIWNESYEKWVQLRAYLMCGAEGSKILVTTRSEIVAQTMGVSSPFVLNGLTIEQSWSLLKNITFPNNTDGICGPLESIGYEIVKKCRGVPLAIRTIGGILLGKDQESEWINVLKGDFWKTDQDETSIMHVLKLSYRHLSPQLRQCFAYCSLYPKDWEIEKNELICLWMSQGYLDECGTQHMEDVGNQFIKILLMKSFFQDAEIDDCGDICSFKMHDLMHDLALQVVGNDCYLDCESKELTKRPMQISLDSESTTLLNSLDASRLRTLFLRRLDIPEPTMLCRDILLFKCLRSLNLSNSYNLEKLPDSMDKLRHLRYLDLSNCYELRSLPKSISNLVNLQILKLAWCRQLESPTKVVTNLANLRHLDIRQCKAFEDMMPVGMGKLSSLQYLSDFYVRDHRMKKNAKLNELKDLNNLRGSLSIKRLGLVRDVALESQDVNLKDKKLLRSLYIHWGRSLQCHQNHSEMLQLLENLRPHQHLKRLVVGSYPGLRFSNWLSSLTNISHISLYELSNCEYLPPLEQLSSLKSLNINSLGALEYICFEVTTAATFFPSLETLQLCNCGNLRGWHRKEGDVSDPHHLSLPPFPRLSKLNIDKCSKLERMPTYPHLVEEFQLVSSPVKPLIDTLNVPSSSSFSPLAMLKSLTIRGPFLDMLPSHWMRNLASLQYLCIDSVDDNIENWLLDQPADCLPSLQTISLFSCKIEALLDRMCSIRSLQRIQIWGCHDLMSLPDGMPRLTNLQTLEITMCPGLADRYRREDCVDRNKISHIKNIIISRE